MDREHKQMHELLTTSCSIDSKGTEQAVVITHGRTLPKWTSEPQPLAPNTFSKWFNIAYDIVICIIPVLLAVKAGLVIIAAHKDRYSGKDGLFQPTAWTKYLIEVNKQLVTLFPVIFVTIVTTLMKRYALWKAQKGATVAELEQFQSSVSLPSTLKMIFLLRAFNYTSAIMILIWSWSYLGSQAAEREYTYQDTSRALISSQKYVLYQKADVPSVFLVNPNVSRSDTLYINSAFRTAFEANSQLGTDFAGYALIPTIVQPEGVLNKSWKPKKSWINIQDVNPEDRSSIKYSSWSSVPVYYVDQSYYFSQWVGRYTLSTSYVYANCSQSSNSSISSFPKGVNPVFTTSYNVSDQTLDGATVFRAWTVDQNGTAYVDCALQQHNVDVKVQCDAATCYCNKIRLTPGASLPTPSKLFEDKNSTQRFLDQLLTSFGIPDDADDWTQSQLFGLSRYDDGEWSGGGLDSSLALTRLINSYLANSQTQYYFSDLYNSLPNNSTYLQDLEEGRNQNTSWPRGKAKGGPYDPGFRLSVPWLVLDFITCGVVLLAALAASWLRTHTVAPDIFGYVSSMTRDNPNVPLPDGGNTLSGVERARALKHVKVKVADLRDASDVGHIGLALAKEDARVVALDKGKHYV